MQMVRFKLKQHTSRPTYRMRPVHPGEVLREDFFVPLEMSANALALALTVLATRTHEIVKERRGITADRTHQVFSLRPEALPGL
jgi:antitoxin HigA-1